MFLHPNWTFIHMPKCAGHAISVFLEDKFPEGEYHASKTHGTAHRPAKKVPDLPHKWGTVRNPWAWYVSFYHFNKNSPLHSEWVGNRSFDEFIKKTLSAKKGNVRHIRLNGKEGYVTLLYRHMFQENGKYLVDKIIRAEDLPPFIPRKNKTKHKHYSHYYTSKTKELVAQKDKYIIQKYGYTFTRR